MTVKYDITENGTHYYKIVAVDILGQTYSRNIITKLDKVLDSSSYKNSTLDVDSKTYQLGIDQSVDFYDLDSKTDAEIRSFAQNLNLDMTFTLSMEETEDQSGLYDYRLIVWAAQDPTVKTETVPTTNFKDYTVSNTSTWAINVSKYNLATQKKAGEYTSEKRKKMSKGTYSYRVNLLNDFSTVAYLRYQYEIYDWAGNKMVVTPENNLIQNFAIKATIYNTDDDNYNIPTDDGTSNIAYMKAGSFGYVDVWTLGYVDTIGLDFGEIGKISADAVRTGILELKYNLGVYGLDGYEPYIRKIDSSKAAEVYRDANGKEFAHRYVYGKNDEKWLSEGTRIRMPINLDKAYFLQQTAIVYGWKNDRTDISSRTYGVKTATNYIIFDIFNTDIHYRVTWE
jgi:hypothetical protein